MKRPIPFGKYYLLERINVGGMAEVFKAKTYGVEGFERLLAVKRILPNIAEDEEFITMFIDEAKIAVQLNHANIAQIFDLGKVDDSFFIALEYVHGKDLRAIFDRCRALTETMPLAQACFITMKICEGLDYAHNKRDSAGREMHLVHRDVSPQNILISYEGEVKLVDFGIAKAAGKASKTEAGILKGKFGYMSPEQVRGLPLDRRSDIFSVGIVLYELLTGERLFLGESDFSTLEKVRNVEILPPSTYNRKIGEELEQIVLKALAKDVEDRYQNAIDLHDDLQAYMYTSGEFYSRKDLAAWMKRTFTREIEEEGRKLEQYRNLPPPSPKPATKPPPPPPPEGGNGKRVPAAQGSPGPQRPPPVPVPDPAMPSGRTTGDGMLATPAPARAAVPSLSWDDEEVETQIYDKPGVSGDLGGAAGKAVEAVDASAPGAARLPLVEVPRERTGRGDRRSTLQVTPTPEVVPRPVTKPKRSHLGVWLSVVLVTVLACGGVLYYFLVLGMKPGNISVVAIPSDVKVYLDGKEQPGSGTPMTIRSLKPGPYIVSVAKPGYERWTKTAEVKPGETIRLAPQLEPLATATIELRSAPPGAEAYLDGRKLEGATPLKITQVTPGKHRLEIRMPPYQPWIHEFEVRPDQVLKLHGALLPAEVAVHVKSTPRAEVVLIRDGKRETMGMSPVTLRLDPKLTYTVAVEKQGYKAWRRPVTFGGGDDAVSLHAVLEKEVAEVVRPTPPPPRPRPRPEPRDTPRPRPRPKPTPPPPPKPVGTGTLLINSNPWTRIFINGRDTGLTTPQTSIPLPAGRHVITLRNPKFGVDISFPVEIEANKRKKVIKRNLLKAQ